MDKKDLIKSVKSEIDYCETTIIKNNPHYVKTEMSRLDLIDKYMFSQFRDGGLDALGQPMVFYNISSLPVEVASKMLDLDTKDIKLIDEIGAYYETWFMEKELRQWMKERYFGRQLNQWAFRLPRDGHIILKKVVDDVFIVPLKSLRFRPDAEDLTKTPIIEKHEYQYDEFVKEARDKGWDNWKFVKKITDTTTGGYFEKAGTKVCVYECWFPEGFLNHKDNWFLISYDGHILAHESMDNMYKGLAWEKMEGRLLGRGQVEKLFNEQIYLNRIANYKAEGLHWSSKRLFQTRDNSINVNLLDSADNGDVFIVNDPLTQIPVEERNLSFYGYDEGRWEAQAMKRCFTTEPVTGQRAPSGTPLGSTMLQAQMTSSYYEQKKEELSLFIKEVLWDWVLPEFKKQTNKEHKIMLRSILSSEEGSDKLFKMLVQSELNKELLRGYVSPAKRELKKSFIAEKIKNSEIVIKKGLYNNLKYKMEINIVGESIDTAGKLQTLQTLLQIIGSNPSVMKDPTIKSILMKMLNIAGFNPSEINFGDEIPTLQEASAQMQATRGGSIAAPPPVSTPQTATSQTTV